MTASYALFLSGQETLYVSVPIMGSVVSYVELGLPLMGVIMGFDLLPGGLETSAVVLLLSQPVTRFQVFAGKIVGRLSTIVMPMILLATIMFLIFASPLSLDLIEKFIVTLLILSLGALFWLGLCSAISAFFRSSVVSLVYCLAVSFLFAYQSSNNLIPSAIVSILSGKVVVPNQGFPNGWVYIMQIYGNELIPGNQMFQVYYLFSSITTSTWWLGRGDQGIGLPVYLLIGYLVILTVLVIFLAGVKFQSIEI